MDGRVYLHTPKPTQDVHSENGNSGSGGDSGQRPLRAGFSVCESVAPDNDGDQARDSSNRSGEERFEGGESAVEGRAARLSKRGNGKEQGKSEH